MKSKIDAKATFYTASPQSGNMVQTSGAFAGKPTVYADELQMLKDAGYVKRGDYLVHPDRAKSFNLHNANGTGQ